MVANNQQQQAASRRAGVFKTTAAGEKVIVTEPARDAMVYATLVSSSFTDRNPVLQMWNDLCRQVKNLLNLRRNMALGELRLQQMRRRIERVEQYMADYQHQQTSGHRLNHLR